MDRARLTSWIAAYVRAWRAPGTGALREIFSPDAVYSAGPYEETHRGLEAIAIMWEAERSPDEEFDIDVEVLAVEGDTGVARISVAYRLPRKQSYLDLWVVRLCADGRCFHFEEWPFWPPGTAGAAGGGWAE
jgi:SnoaL-like domain